MHVACGFDIGERKFCTSYKDQRSENCLLEFEEIFSPFLINYKAGVKYSFIDITNHS